MITDEQLAEIQHDLDTRQQMNLTEAAQIFAGHTRALLAEMRRLRATERQYTVGRQRIADLMGWCARELGASHIHAKIREYLAIPDAAYSWQLPHPEHPQGGDVPVESAPVAEEGK